MPPKFAIWSNADLPDDVTARLVEGTSGHRLILDSDRSSNLGAGGPSALMSDADIAFGQPDPGQIMELPRLQWVHITSAGYTRYDRDDLRQALRRRGAQLTNSSSVFDEPCAQHVLAFMLAVARQLPQSLVDQLGNRTWTYAQLRPATRLLAGTVLILGCGAIARRLAELLEPFHLKVIAVRRGVCGDEPIPTRSVDELESLLPLADHVVNTLPANPSTDRLIDGSRLEKMKAGAAFYNIGRGTTVDTDALIGALASGHLGCAYLDVTDPEPLPSDHPLWKAPNCYITPHIGGGHKEEYPRLVEHFLENLKRFESGESLADRII